jgi:hypothetical protein
MAIGCCLLAIPIAHMAIGYRRAGYWRLAIVYILDVAIVYWLLATSNIFAMIGCCL